VSRRAAAVTNDTFRSLRTRNYRLYWVGQVVSMTGTWLQFIAQALLVLRLTGSGVALGIVTALQFLPVLIVGGWAGVLADRVDKRRLMYATQTAMMLLALVLGGLTLAGVVTVWHVYLLAALTGFAGAFDQPARRALIPELVADEDINNAVGLSSALFTGARVVGPALAGWLIATVGMAWCFLLNGVSFVAVLVGLALMDATKFRSVAPVPRAKGQIREGFQYVWQTTRLRLVLAVMGVVALLAFNWQVLVPLMATRTFHGTETTYTIITSMMSVGSLIGSLVLARRRQVTIPFLLLMCLIFGVTSLMFALAPSVPVAIITGMLAAGFGIAFMTGTMTFVQTEARPEMRGRVMALYAMLFMGTTPFGGPLMGWVAEHLGVRFGLAVGGIGALVAAGSVVLVAQFRARRGLARPEPMTVESSVASLGV
jgi:MFS family permease